MNEISIPVVKLKPDFLFDVLMIIRNNYEFQEKMNKELINYFINKSSRLKIKREEELQKSIVRGVILPSLRTLELIFGVQPNIILSVNSRKILKILSEKGYVEAKKTLEELLYKIDKEKCQVLSLLLELCEFKKTKNLKLKNLLRRLELKFKITTEKDRRVLKDRLGRWLSYFEYAGFIEKDSDLKVNTQHIRHCEIERRISIPLSKFIKAIFTEYNKIKDKTGLVYVPIPQLMILLWKKFPNMWKWDLEKYLECAWKKINAEYIILLSEPMQRREGGIRIANKYYYYLSIHKK